MGRRRYISIKFQITRRQNCYHALSRTHCVKIHTIERSRSNRTGAKSEVKCPVGCWDVVNVSRTAVYMKRGGIVGEGLSNAHGVTSCTDVV